MESKELLEDDNMGENRREEESKKCCPRVNRPLLVPKLFYFFFFSGWGSLLPYLALYFKQLLLTPTQVGILMGLKPFVNFLVIPLWGAIVDRFNKSRLVLIISLIALIIATFSISLVPPPVQRKILTHKLCNETEQIKRVVDLDSEMAEPEIDKMVENNKEKYRSVVNNAFTEGNPWPLNAITNFKAIEGTYIDSDNCFITLFIITFLGTLISSPSLALVDTATMQILGPNTHRYGMQRLTGSIGWGLGASVVGASLKTTHKCDKDRRVEVVDFIPCFYAFAGLMLTALMIATKFRFSDDDKKTEAKKVGLLVGLQALRNSKYLMFLFTALYLGFLMAFIKTFLFWHLKDLGGPQLLFSVISAVNCFAEVSMYFLSSKLIKCIGHARVLYLGLICYSVRLLYYAFLENPWYVLPVEILPGITTAAVWAACLSYVSKNSKPGAKTTMQCILHGVHWGLGYGAGEIIGGLLVHRFGAPFTFVIFGVLCIVILIIYILIDTFGKEPEGSCYEAIDGNSPLDDLDDAKPHDNEEKSAHDTEFPRTTEANGKN